MVCLGVEPVAQTNPLSYGGTPGKYILVNYLGYDDCRIELFGTTC